MEKIGIVFLSVILFVWAVIMPISMIYLFDEKISLIKSCEAELPRYQKCALTAVPEVADESSE